HPPCIGIGDRRRLGLGYVFRCMLGDHLLNVGSTASAAVTGRRSRPRGDLMQRPGALMDGAQDRPVLDVVASADGRETADYRMQLFGAVHLVEANTLIP